jgi:hypothetical protein
MLMLPLALVLSAAPVGPPVKYPGLSDVLKRAGTSLDAQLKAMEQTDSTMTMHQEEVDSDGKVTHVTDRVMRTTHPEGKPHVELVSVVEDGKDITAKERADDGEHDAKSKDEKAKRHGGMSISSSNPFAAETQPKYRFWVVAPLPAAGQPVRIHFEPNGDATKEEMKGEALVDPTSGAVSELDFTPADPPPMVDHLDIQMRFGGATAVPLITAMNVDGAGHLLFFKKHMRIQTKFEYPAQATK